MRAPSRRAKGGSELAHCPGERNGALPLVLATTDIVRCLAIPGRFRVREEGEADGPTTRRDRWSSPTFSARPSYRLLHLIARLLPTFPVGLRSLTFPLPWVQVLSTQPLSDLP